MGKSGHYISPMVSFTNFSMIHTGASCGPGIGKNILNRGIEEMICILQYIPASGPVMFDKPLYLLLYIPGVPKLDEGLVKASQGLSPPARIVPLT